MAIRGRPLTRTREFVEKYKKIGVFFFFVLYFLVGHSIYDDYGISWDEPLDRELGILSYRYVFLGDDTLLSFPDRDYGMAFQLPLILAEVKSGLQDSHEIFFLRHFITFLLFFLGTIAFYFLSKTYLQNWKAGLLATLFLILSPRIFADSFYNGKDMASFSAFIIAMLTLFWFLGTKGTEVARLTVDDLAIWQPPSPSLPIFAIFAHLCMEKPAVIPHIWFAQLPSGNAGNGGQAYVYSFIFGSILLFDIDPIVM